MPFSNTLRQGMRPPSSASASTGRKAQASLTSETGNGFLRHAWPPGAASHTTRSTARRSPPAAAPMGSSASVKSSLRRRTCSSSSGEVAEISEMSTSG
ncbi:Uncharacterised protein [Bordetella pertussis]|nr:Uncharacterised protein [Bordetella pertussis]